MFVQRFEIGSLALQKYIRMMFRVSKLESRAKHSSERYKYELRVGGQIDWIYQWAKTRRSIGISSLVERLRRVPRK